LFVVFGLIFSFCRILCLHTGASAIERNCSTLERTPATDSTSIGGHAHSRHHHWQISVPALDPTYLALERTSTGSSSVDFCQNFIFGPFCEFLNFSFIFF
jgi:hypothetical protein